MQETNIPGVGSSLGEGTGYPLQYSCLENPIDRGARQATVHGVTRVRHNLLMKPPQQYHLSFHYYHLIFSLDVCIFKCKAHFSLRSLSTLILGKPENNYNDRCPLGYDWLVLRWPQVHALGFHPLWCSPAVSVELSDSPACRFYHFFPVEVKIPP